ncbi:MAG: hypothetical protein HGA76_06890 [Candidatus Firestonebacteria bacterium]|nr:hypothetical protein [Candidatus Firestonebacteria bacterium]
MALAGSLSLLGGCGGQGAGKSEVSQSPGPMETFKAMAEAIRTNGATPTTGGIYTYLHGVDDRARLAFVSTVENQTQICTIRPDGTELKVITTGEGYKSRPVWSVDHKKIAFFQYASDHPQEDKVNVMVMDADGGNSKAALAHRSIDCKKTRICWSMDAGRLYVQEKDFPSVLFGYAVADGQQVDTVRIPKTSFLKEVQTLSPDAALIAGVGPDPKTGFQHMGAVKVSGGSDLDFMKYFMQKTSLHLGTVVWSYDSSLVAYEMDSAVIIMSSSYTAVPKFRFYGLNPLELESAYTSPAFSPEGQYIACILEKTKEGTVGTGDREVKSDLWVMNIDGSKPRQLTNTGSNFDPTW